MNKNTALICEPRQLEYLPQIIKQFQYVLKDWNFVFYCGKDLKNYWKNILENIDIRELNENNLSSDEYNDFFKKKSLWESLEGEYVLVFQADTWIHNDDTYDINYFIKLNKSYIGGNMDYEWKELKRELINPEYKNFNGGLSLRKRKDMIDIINNFEPKKSHLFSEEHCSDAEDVYFTIGCYKLGLPLGDDEESSHFSVHDVYKNKWFGLHKPNCKQNIIMDYPELNVFLDNFIEVNSQVQQPQHAIFDEDDDF